MFAVIAAMAEFERAHPRGAAPGPGKRLGSPPRVYHRDRVLPLRLAGKSLRAIAKELGISRRAVQRALERAQNRLADFCATEAISQGWPAP